MGSAVSRCKFFTASEYLIHERAAETRSEFVNGTLVTMAGGTIAHDTITGNILRQIGNRLVGRPCRVFASNIKVRIERTNLFRYPDISALCGPIALHDEIGDVYLNPSLFWEVLSPRTEAYNPGEKFAL